MCRTYFVGGSSHPLTGNGLQRTLPVLAGPRLREINRALSREDKEHTSILFPIRIDNYLFDEWKHARKADVLEKVVDDFRNWKDDHVYQKALERLIRELKQAKVRGN